MNYTKGEWKLDDTRTAIFSGGRLVANCGGYTLTQHESEALEQNKANAHLIASAPDMYEALKALLPNSHNPLAQSPLHGKWEVDGNALEKARLALAKAEGKG